MIVRKVSKVPYILLFLFLLLLSAAVYFSIPKLADYLERVEEISFVDKYQNMFIINTGTKRYNFDEFKYYYGDYQDYEFDINVDTYTIVVDLSQEKE